jgi:hypothetical protein
MIIEEGYSNNQSEVMLDEYYIDFKHRIQVFHYDPMKQRPVKRIVNNRDDKHLREERFMADPIAPKLVFGGEYGWIPPFILEIKEDLGLRENQLPSKDAAIIPLIVERAAIGIIEEGKKLGKRHEAEKLASLLIEKKNKGMEEVWKMCAYLYSLESFLYKNMNQVMRLVGNNEDQQIWRNKLRTLGPFCLLLWDDPINDKLTMGITLYRGASLNEEHIAAYRDMTTRPDEYRSFQAFTSTSRNRAKAEQFGNSLFVMKIIFAFIADMTPLSQYADEEEELISPGACFQVERMEFDRKTNKHIIYLTIMQRFSSEYEQLFHNLFNLTTRLFKSSILIFHKKLTVLEPSHTVTEVVLKLN